MFLRICYFAAVILQSYIKYSLVHISKLLAYLLPFYLFQLCTNGFVKLTKLTKNADPDKYVNTDYGIRFDSRSKFLWSDGSMEKDVVIFGDGISSSGHMGNKGKDVLIFGEVPTQGLDDTTFFFYMCFLSQPFINHRTGGERRGHFFNSSLPLPPFSKTIRN